MVDHHHRTYRKEETRAGPTNVGVGAGTGRNVVKWKNGAHDFSPPRKGMPTCAPPGTLEKVLVFKTREARGEELFHSHDARYDGDLRPLEWMIMMQEAAVRRGVPIGSQEYEALCI